ncbi:MAG: glycosyltransferase family 2 protein [Planctomycetia bacterium]|nr:glycosyltransferase family 2 protein [Planctomycetia bacterium]
MLTATVLVVMLLAAAGGFQTIWCSRFAALFRQPKSQPVPDAALPKVAVVMTLRGADPFLDRTLQGLTQLDYPRYDIRIIVDNKEDPAWEMVQRIVAQRACKNVVVEELSQRRSTCSLRMSSLIQAVAGLDDSYDVVTIIDADVVTYPTYLRDLVAPMSDPEVGATSGVRWFMPDEANAGSLVRYIWNAAAVAQMHAFGVGWGGSLAVRTSLLRDANILDKWSKIMFEDTFTVGEVQSLGAKLKWVAEATMINRESIDVKGCTKFISRQILNARMYHRSWRAIAAYAVLSALALNGAILVGAAALLLGHTAEAGAVGGALAGYAACMAALLIWSEAVARGVARQRGELIQPLTWKLIGAGLLTHYVYLASVLMAVRVKEIEWRGIKYNLGGPRKVHLQHYAPFRPHHAAQDARVSL